MKQISFKARILGLMFLTLAIAQIATFSTVIITVENIVHSNVVDQVQVAEEVFQQLISNRNTQLLNTVEVLSNDFGFKEAVLTNDSPTIGSVLENHGRRINSNIALLFSLDAKIIASTLDRVTNEDSSTLNELLVQAEKVGQYASYATISGKPYQVVVAAIRAPVRVAWLVMGFSVDDQLANSFKRLTGLDVTFTGDINSDSTFIASTLQDSDRLDLDSALRAKAIPENAMRMESQIGQDMYLTSIFTLNDGTHPVTAILQKSISEAMQPFRYMEISLILIFTVFLIIGSGIAIILARSVTRPLNKLVLAAGRIGEGKYNERIDISRDDEIGKLASTLNSMQVEISDREKKILHQATHDELTGLPNRWLAISRLEHAIQLAKRENAAVSLLLVDFSGFQQVNNSLGHHIGNVVLQEVARRFTARLRESDTVARIGGDEFLLILGKTTSQQGIEIVNEMMFEIGRSYNLDGVQISLSINVGISEYPTHGDEPDLLIQRADIALFDAKESQTTAVIYETGRDTVQRRQLAIISDLPEAITGQQLVLHFQPKVNIRTGKIEKAEALVRWIHPEYGFLPPDEFITILERSGNIMKLTQWVLETAIKQSSSWREVGLDIQVAVNLSAEDLLHEDLVDTIHTLLDKYELQAGRLILEITESAIMRNPLKALEILNELKANGINLSIDDFGTGYSSLAQLKRLPVNEIKVDKSFVLNLKRDSEDAVIVRSTIDLAHNLGLTVVAEGVENAEGWFLLNEYGCDMAQGYLISKPLPAPALEAWLAEAAPNTVWTLPQT